MFQSKSFLIVIFSPWHVAFLLPPSSSEKGWVSLDGQSFATTSTLNSTATHFDNFEFCKNYAFHISRKFKQNTFDKKVIFSNIFLICNKLNKSRLVTMFINATTLTATTRVQCRFDARTSSVLYPKSSGFSYQLL